MAYSTLFQQHFKSNTLVNLHQVGVSVLRFEPERRFLSFNLYQEGVVNKHPPAVAFSVLSHSQRTFKSPEKRFGYLLLAVAEGLEGLLALGLRPVAVGHRSVF